MALALSIIGVGFAAFCIWLTVRIINRRERWAKRTLATLVGLLLLYVASIGPVAWAIRQPWCPRWTFGLVQIIYAPIILVESHGPEWIRDMIESYADLWR